MPEKPLGFHRLDVEANPVSKADAWVIGSCADKADILVGYSDNDAVEDRTEEIHCALDFYPKHNSLYVRAIPGAQVICKDIDDIGKKTRTAGAVTGLTISGQSWTLKFEQNYSQQKLENQMDAMRARRKQDSIKQPLVAVPTPSVDAIDYKRWTLDKVINHGGNGAIYSGRNVDTGQPMAATMMIIHANSRDVVRREILALRTLQSVGPFTPNWDLDAFQSTFVTYVLHRITSFVSSETAIPNSPCWTASLEAARNLPSSWSPWSTAT